MCHLIMLDFRFGFQLSINRVCECQLLGALEELVMGRLSSDVGGVVEICGAWYPPKAVHVQRPLNRVDNLHIPHSDQPPLVFLKNLPSFLKNIQTIWIAASPHCLSTKITPHLPLQQQFKSVLRHLQNNWIIWQESNMSSGAEKLKNNKTIAILDAAEKGNYGVVSVCCVCLSPFDQLWYP